MSVRDAPVESGPATAQHTPGDNPRGNGPRPGTRAPWPEILGLVAVLGLVVVFGVNNALWLRQSDPFWMFGDAPLHYDSARLAWDNFQAEQFGTSFIHRLREYLGKPRMYPPFAYLVSAAWFRVTGDLSYDSANRSQLLFVLILALSVYAIGRRVATIGVGVAAVFLTLTSRSFLLQSKSYLLDVPASAAVALCCWAALTTEGFRRRGPSLLFGAAMLMALFTKYQTVLFLAPIVAYGVIGAMRAVLFEKHALWRRLGEALVCGSGIWVPLLLLGGSGPKSAALWWAAAFGAAASLAASMFVRSEGARRLANLCLAVDIFLVAAMPAVWTSWDEIARYYAVASVSQAVDVPIATRWLSMSVAYLKIIEQPLLGGLFLAAFLLGSVALTVRREQRVRLGLPMTVAFFSWFALSLMPLAKDRYLLPALPFFAIVVSAWLLGPGPRPLRGLKKTVLGILFLIGTAQWFGWGTDRVPAPPKPSGGHTTILLTTEECTYDSAYIDWRDMLGRVLDLGPWSTNWSIVSERPWRSGWNPITMLGDIDRDRAARGLPEASVRVDVDRELAARDDIYPNLIRGMLFNATAHMFRLTRLRVVESGGDYLLCFGRCEEAGGTVIARYLSFPEVPIPIRTVRVAP